MLKKLLVLSLLITQSLAFAKESTVVSPAKESTKFQVAEETNSDSTNTDKEEKNKKKKKKKNKKKKKVKKAYPERYFRRYFLGGLIPGALMGFGAATDGVDEAAANRYVAPGTRVLAFAITTPIVALITGGVVYGAVKIFDRIRGPVKIKKPEKKAEKKRDKKAKTKKKQKKKYA